MFTLCLAPSLFSAFPEQWANKLAFAWVGWLFMLCRGLFVPFHELHVFSFHNHISLFWRILKSEITWDHFLSKNRFFILTYLCYSCHSSAEKSEVAHIIWHCSIFSWLLTVPYINRITVFYVILLRHCVM